VRLGEYGFVVCCAAGGASALVSEARRVVWRAHGKVQVVDPCRHMHWVSEPCEVLSDGHDECVERATGGFLAKLTGGKAENVTGD
jgi:hypothetical protein